VLGMAGSVFSLDEPEAPPGEQTEGVGVVVHGVRVDRRRDGSNGCRQNVPVHPAGGLG
jgi:hypothetical protein